MINRHVGLLYRFIIILVLDSSTQDYNVKYFNYKKWSSARLLLLVASVSSVSVHKYIFQSLPLGPVLQYIQISLTHRLLLLTFTSALRLQAQTKMNDSFMS